MGLDVGTTGMKIGVYRAENGALKLAGQYSQSYEVNTYNNGQFSDIEPEKWQAAFAAGCRQLGSLAAEVDAIGISGTTPGLTAMDQTGAPLYPAILMLDQRSRAQAAEIIERIGLRTLLEATGNMPVAGGCSLASILWLRDHRPEVFQKAACFGHSNTFMARWLTGTFAIDPSSASLTALYNTTANDLTWNAEIASAFGIRLEQLPRLLPASESTGRVLPELARELGLRRQPLVVIGGNDAVLAAYSIGIREPGDFVNVNGTCEISMVCLDRCHPSTKYNIRAHVIPGRWVTLYVMNAEARPSSGSTASFAAKCPRNCSTGTSSLRPWNNGWTAKAPSPIPHSSWVRATARRRSKPSSWDSPPRPPARKCWPRWCADWPSTSANTSRRSLSSSPSNRSFMSPAAPSTPL